MIEYCSNNKKNVQEKRKELGYINFENNKFEKKRKMFERRINTEIESMRRREMNRERIDQKKEIEMESKIKLVDKKSSKDEEEREYDGNVYLCITL